VETVRSRDGTLIAYERTGQGPIAVLVHGSGGDHRIWRRPAAHLAADLTVVSMARRGRGGSGPYTGDHVIEREYEDVAVLADAFDEPVVLVGHSYGARCCLHGALLSARGVRGLVLYDPPVFRPTPAHVVDRFAELVAAGDRDGAAELFFSEFGDPPAEVARRRATSGWRMVADNAHTIAPEFGALRGYRFDPGDFADLRVPTLVLVGGASPPNMRQSAAGIVAALPDARLEVLDGQAHLAMVTGPEPLARAIRRHVRECDQPSDGSVRAG
jgi:pimeloyl-ACP methyl ester carboxylesterase